MSTAVILNFDAKLALARHPMFVNNAQIFVMKDIIHFAYLFIMLTALAGWIILVKLLT